MLTPAQQGLSAFTGSIPEIYDRHLGPVLFEPYARALAARLPAGATRVLEVAAGTGRLTRQLLARLAADGTILATDLNPDMLACASKVIDDPRVRWLPADAQQLPAADGEFDVVACQFGLMFVPDKARALREMRRVLVPGGTLVLATWDALVRNPLTEVFHALASATTPDDPPSFMLTPFSMPDPVALDALVREAGFAEVRVETVAAEAIAVSAADVAIGLVRGNPLWNQLVARGIDADAFQQTVVAEIAARFGDRPCRSMLSAHLVVASDA